VSTVPTGTRSVIRVSASFGASGRYYEFSHPLELIVEEDADGNWHHTIEEFNIWVVEPSRDESVKGLEEYFDFLYEVYGLADNSKLSPKAIELKQRILNTFRPLS
jgi:hypothetical protein